MHYMRLWLLLPAVLTLHDASGMPVRDLEPVMGAYAHMVGFSADGNRIIHCHPVGDEPQYAGKTQFYVQIRRQGNDTYIPSANMYSRSDRL
ncbi:MAG: hypothetical protein AB7L92_06035 [Alphaproteobacteria bacterium]